MNEQNGWILLGKLGICLKRYFLSVKVGRRYFTVFFGMWIWPVEKGVFSDVTSFWRGGPFQIATDLT